MLAGLALVLGGCNGIIPGVGPAPNLYDLTPKSTYAPNLPRVDWQLVIEEPRASGGLDTKRIALRPTPTEIKYFAEARWTERAPRMVQSLLVESFENTGKIVAVGRLAVGLTSDYNLQAELREFQAEYFDGSKTPTVNVRINVKVVKQPDQVIIASRSFETKARAESANMRAIIDAFDRAFGKVVKEIVQWTLLTTDAQH